MRLAYARKKDAIHKICVAAWKKMGLLVHDTNGAWDATLQKGQFTLMVEIKTGEKAKYTPLQKDMLEDGWHIQRVNSLMEAIEIGQWVIKMSNSMHKMPPSMGQKAL